MSKDPDNYFVFVKQGYDRPYFCVAGHEISLENAIMFLTPKEANQYAEFKSKTRNESRSASQRENSTGTMA